ncbi:MAG: transcription-repair coupling factor, partial [Gammaproteobacteria bacterium]
MTRTASPPDRISPGPSPLSPGLPGRGEHLLWTGLGGDSLALAIANTVQAATGPLLVVTPDMQTAEQLQEQVAFFAGRDELSIITFPDWETLPYDSFSPHQDIISGRLATLYRLADLQGGLLIVSVATLLQRLPPADFIYKNSLVLNTGERVVLEEMRTRLGSSGYRCVAQVMEHGEFAVRGSLLDLYPMGSELPYRIDLFDEEIESIRTFDPETQRSLERQESIRLLPAR